MVLIINGWIRTFLQDLLCNSVPQLIHWVFHFKDRKLFLVLIPSPRCEGLKRENTVTSVGLIIPRLSLRFRTWAFCLSSSECWFHSRTSLSVIHILAFIRCISPMYCRVILITEKNDSKLYFRTVLLCFPFCEYHPLVHSTTHRPLPFTLCYRRIMGETAS